jgi:glycosyltransferase involved in cell wall biosynthesis
LAYRLIINSAIKRSEKIITVSEFTKKDILENYKNIASEKINITYEACEKSPAPSSNKDEEILGYYGIIKPYLIYVGNAYPHKNLEKLVSAFSLLREDYPHLSLAFVGKEDYFYLRLKKLVKDKKIKNIIFLGYVPDCDLDSLHRNASAYVFPSLYEGFGLPPLEAMAVGTPVISSDHPCMQEILGNSAYYFNGRVEAEIAKAIKKILADNALREKLIAAGYQQVKKYGWGKMAKETLKIYKSLLSI